MAKATKGIFTVALAATFTFSQVLACDITGKTGFAPENNLRIEVEDKLAGDMTEQVFLDSINRVATIYAPIVKNKGGALYMNNLWNDGTVNASAQQSGTRWQVNMYGGLARHPKVTVDAFMMVVCHELGHHIGGAPRKGDTWASNEGQSDYFASLKCMRRVLEKDDNIAAVAKMKIDQEVTAKCQMIYKSAAEVALCQRISMAGKSLAELLGELGGTPVVNFTTPDIKIVTTTNPNHPKAQCRLDTYFQGSLCDKAISEDVSKSDPVPGTCIKRDGHKFGVRPLCWYKPDQSEL